MKQIKRKIIYKIITIVVNNLQFLAQIVLLHKTSLFYQEPRVFLPVYIFGLKLQIPVDLHFES